MTTENNSLLLIDGSSYLYRAFHALPPLTNSKGQPTGAIYGVVNMLKRLMSDHPPTHVAVVFDAKGPTFRDELYELYKAHRQAMPDDLVKQIEPLHRLVKAMGLPLLCVPGVEADDVIATLAQQAAAQNIKTIISTGDKDLTQLVNDHITVINTMNNAVYDRDGVIKKFLVAPEQIVDYLTLIGDSSDNVPGVPGCGPKTAVKWLTEYGSLKNIILNAENISGKVGDSFRATIPQLPLFRELITVKTDVPLTLDIHHLHPQQPQQEMLALLYEELEFKTWLRELANNSVTLPEAAAPITKPHYHINYQTILTQVELDNWIKRLKQAALFAFDTETNSLSYTNAEIIGVSFALQSHEAAYIPLGHDYLGAPEQLNRIAVLEQLKPILENPAIKKICQHGKFDMNVLRNYDIHLRGVAFDTMLESYVFNSVATRHNMEALAKKYLQRDTISFEDIAGKGKKQLTFNQIPLEQAAHYAAEDADITLQLHQTLWPKIQAVTGLAHVFTEIEMPLMPVLSKMECIGVLIDKARLNKLSEEFSAKIEVLRREAFKEAGQEFNLDSPKQLQEILFDKLGLPTGKMTAGGQASTAEAVLIQLAESYHLPALIMEHRTYAKLKSTYTDKLPLLIDNRTGRVHTSYNQALTSTGRLSSSDPNLQNIPIRDEQGRKIRQAFIAPQGYKILAADYSQIELRIMAHLSGDKNLLHAFENELDIHAATAAEVMGIPLEAVTVEQRRSAKAINFGLIYGMSAFGLAKQLNVPRGAAQDYINIYFARYPGVKQYMENSRRKAHQDGFVETLSGRRLYLAGINDRNKMQQQAAERAAINAPLQGTAADIIKLAMINLDRALAKFDARMIMQVHDELVFEIAESQIDAARDIIQHEMMQAFKLHVPLTVGIGIGNNWDAAH